MLVVTLDSKQGNVLVVTLDSKQGNVLVVRLDSKQGNVLVVTLDSKRNFAPHLLNTTKYANKKLNALTPVKKYMTTDQKKLIFYSFIKSQFTNCSLIWMFCTKRSLRRINNLHDRCLRLTQQNCRSKFERLVENADEKSVHQKYIEFL